MSLEIINSIVDGIRNNEIEIVSENIRRLPIELLSIKQSDLLLAKFLNEILIHKNIEMTRFLIDTFDVARIRTDPLPAVTQLFTNGNLLMDILKFVITCYPEKSPSDYFLDLINSTDDRMAVEAARLLTKIFPNLDGATWKYLYSLTEPCEGEPYHNPLLRTFFEMEMDRIRPILSKPEYVKDFEEVRVDPIPFELPNMEDAVKRIINNLKVQNMNFIGDNGKVVDITEPLIAQYAMSTIDEKRELLGDDTIPSGFNDDIIFREYGPVNCIYKHDYLPSDHECKKWGGCRMFLCNEFEMTSDDLMAEESQEVDWFTGACEHCEITIPYRHYALREPLKNGGWRGCYCELCLSNKLKDNFLFIRMKEQLMRIGIRNR